MTDILVQTREASPRLHDVRPHGTPLVVPNVVDPTRDRDKFPSMPVANSAAAGELARRTDAEPPLSLGSVLHLGSVGLIAAAIVVVFFGAGYSLLVRTAGGAISSSVGRADPEITSLSPSLGKVDQQTFLSEKSARRNKEIAQTSAALPAPTEAPAIDGKHDAPRSGGVLATKVPIATPPPPANAPGPTPNSPAATAPPTSGLPTAELTQLSDHGDALLRDGDVASARLFYERAADAGDAQAAVRLGATYDPEFLGRLGLSKLQANPAEARSWYSRALELGAGDAKRQLNSLATRQGNSFQ
jgi:hypothetical protein